MEIITRLGIKIIVCFLRFTLFFFVLHTNIEVFETQLQNCMKPNFCQSFFQVEKNQLFSRN